MEKLDNTGLGLINATIERVQNKKSLFGSALKKLVNSSEEDLGNFLNNQVVSKWREENGVIYFSVTSNGRTGEEWIKSLKKGGHTVTDYAKSILRSPDFHPTNGITYEIAVLKGELFTDDNRITKNIRKEAQERGFSTPNAEVACLIREKFSDKELEAMGLIWIVTMHDPIKDSGGDPRLLSADRYCGGSGLSASYGGPDGWGSRKSGFAFAVSQVPL